MKKDKSPYDPAKIEEKWQRIWSSKRIYTSKEKKGKKKYYVLDMFPYPSGEGLHVGHPKGYIATDVVSRMKRMQGYNVLHPMGFDAFGLPAENYAIKTKTNPEIAVKKNVARYKQQLELLGLDYDWKREVNTTDPNYYKWTQWIFLQLFKKGLAYESYEPINWCPSCKTGLANEDVEDGRCERCGTVVEKKPMRQWVLRITDYADKLLNDLDAVSGVPMVTHKEGPDAFRADMPIAERNAVVCIVKHHKEDKYLCVNWKATKWQGFVIGGIEAGENIEEASIREVQEETGYKNLKFVRESGRVDARFYQVVKKENRLAHYRGVYLELINDDRDVVSEHELALQDAVWLDRTQVSDFLNRSDMKYLWDLYTGSETQDVRPLLDWQESIKDLQKNWIGRSEGARISFPLDLNGKKCKFVLIHGYKGSPDDDFFPSLKKHLESLGHSVQVPKLPNPVDPKESEQVDFILSNCEFDEGTIVLGHSLGGVVALKALMRANKKINRLILVAPAQDPSRKKISNMKDRPFWNSFNWNYDYNQLKGLVKDIVVLSDKQETNRMEYLRFLSNKLSAKLIEVQAREKHFTSENEPAIRNVILPAIEVFTTRPDTLFGVTYVVLAPEHNLVQRLLASVSNQSEVTEYIENARNIAITDRTDDKRTKTGVIMQGIRAINPVNGESVPIYIADYVLADYGTGAVMAVPAHDVRDYDFAKKYDLPIRRVIETVEDLPSTKTGIMTNSGTFNGKDSSQILKEITRSAGGEWTAQYKLRDWVFSRQRYWGEPIPLIHCDKCGVVPVPESKLPVKLPKVKSYEPTGTGESPLASISKWVNTRCPNCRGKAHRETNTMPQWAGSSWYYLRYTDPTNRKSFASSIKEKYWSPVDLYVGGAEHATRHLIYARFWHKFLYDLGHVSSREPFRKLQSVGLIMGEDGKKMSKRFGNVVNPDDIVKTFGADTLRLYEMFMGPFDQAISWSTSSMVGARRFIERVWKLSEKVVDNKIAGDISSQLRIIHETVKRVTEDIESLRFNTAVSSLMICSNELEKLSEIPVEDYLAFLKLLAPFAPHVTEELWSRYQGRLSIHVSDWPRFDPSMLVKDETSIVIQVNGKVRSSIVARTTSTRDELQELAMADSVIQKWIAGKNIIKVIVVPGRLVNIVIADK